MQTTDSAVLAPPALHFGPSRRFELQPTERRLLVDGRPAPLGRRALDLLIVLAERPDQLLTKDELLARVWPGVVVEEGNLQMQVSNLRKVIGAEMIATVPGMGYRFIATVHRSAPVVAPPSPRDGHRLIGRDHDLARLEGLLREGDVTLVGMAGVGKTSLARAAAQRWPGRSVWVDLAALSAPATGGRIAGAVARALGVQLAGRDADALAQLRAALRNPSLLLVLDNAEHLVAECAGLVAALQSPQGSRVLVTSQLRLSFDGERLMRLEPLALPDDDAGLEPSAPQGALTLLVDRIKAVDPRFAPTADALPLLRAICTQLDGLPLALEMAAARVPLLGLRGVHDALAHRFAMLTRGHRDTAGRHRTLHAALDWSYQLLAPAEQRLLRALGCFAEGFTLDLAVRLLTDDAEARWDIIDRLTTLAEHSLLSVGSGDPPRYRLLETIRAFALEQLAGTAAPGGEAFEFRRRHAQALLALFASRKVDDPASQQLCVAEMGNVREAIVWAQTHDLETAATLSWRVAVVATFTVWRQESSAWLRALEPSMDGPAGRALPVPVQANWWTERARVAAISREGGASGAGRRGVALWRPLGLPDELLRAAINWVRCIGVAGAELDEACAVLRAQAASMPGLTPRQRLFVTGALTWAAVIRADRAAELAGHEEELRLAREIGHQDGADAAESGIVETLNALGRHAEAAERGRALLARVDADGSGRNGNLPWVLGGLFGALTALGRLDEARSLLPRLFDAARRFATPISAPVLCNLLVAENRPRASARLIGYTRERHAAQGITFDSVEETGLARAMAAAVEALGPALAERLVQQGRALSDDDAEALVSGTEP